MKTTELTPRAIAVLCALRSGPKTTNQLGSGIGDGTSSAGRQETRGLLDSMRSRTLIVQRNDQPPRWYLDHDGLGWLQSHGLDAVAEVRAWNGEEGRAAALDRHLKNMAPVIDAINAGMEATGNGPRCPHGNMPREAGAEHWRDWHRGHGCHLDPDVRSKKGTP